MVVQVCARCNQRANRSVDEPLKSLDDIARERARLGLRTTHGNHPLTFSETMETADGLKLLATWSPDGVDARFLPVEISRPATRAGELLTARGLPPLPNTTPHTLRRTYISIALLANNFDVKWVMDQVGHADSKMTMDVYAQLQQRAKRDHGAHFDELVRQARVQLRTPDETASNASIGTAIGTGDPKSPISAPDRAPTDDQKHAFEQAKSEMARPRLELGTPRFSVVCSTN